MLGRHRKQTDILVVDLNALSKQAEEQNLPLSEIVRQKQQEHLNGDNSQTKHG